MIDRGRSMPWSLISDPRHLAPFKRRRASATLNSQRSTGLLRQPHRARSLGPDLGRIHPPAVAALGRTAGPGRARPAAGARARPWLHRRLPGRADREGRHALPHLERGGVDGGGRRRDAWVGGVVPGVGARVSRRLAPSSEGGRAQRPTLNAQRSTLNAQRSTLNAQRSTLNAQRSTLNAQRSTLNAQRSTLNAQR